MNFFSSWLHGIKGKLLIAALMPVIGFSIVNVISYLGIKRINTLLSSSHNEIIPNMQVLSDMRVARNKFAYKVFSEVANVEIHDAAAIAADLGEVKAAIDDYEAAYKTYSASTFMPEEGKAFEAAKEDFPKMIALMKRIYALIETKDDVKSHEGETLLKTEFAVLGKRVSAYTAGAIKLYNERAKNEGHLAAEAEEQVTWWTIFTVVAANIFISGYVLWTASGISKAVSGIASRLTDAGANVSSSVEQLNDAGNGLSQSATESAASLEETVASLEEMSSMVRMNSDNAKQAAALSATSREAAEKGQHEMQSLIDSMNQISSSSKKIEEIIHVIDDIAFQTNLLALNAAVEAARAGEQGKGFAVVAEAVRALAQRSAASAKDINSLIKESVQQIDDGSKIASSSGTMLSNIFTAVKKVADLNNEIATASSEQTAGIQQISKAMNQLDQSSQSNAASAEEIAATSGEINNLAQTSLSLTVDLNNVIYGKNTTPPARKTASDVSPVPSRKAQPNGNVVAFTPRGTGASAKPAKKTDAAHAMIPFDDDEGRAKVGTTDGF